MRIVYFSSEFRAQAGQDHTEALLKSEPHLRSRLAVSVDVKSSAGGGLTCKVGQVESTEKHCSKGGYAKKGLANTTSPKYLQQTPGQPRAKRWQCMNAVSFHGKCEVTGATNLEEKEVR